MKIRVQKILEEWSLDDNTKWTPLALAALHELIKIGREYLEDHMAECTQEYIAHNLDLERSFSILKQLDTRVARKSIPTLESTIMFKEAMIRNQGIMPAKMSALDLAFIRKRGRMLPPAKVKEQKIWTELKRKQQEQEEKKKGQEQRKRKEKKV